jgi:hypothetical protein
LLLLTICILGCPPGYLGFFCENSGSNPILSSARKIGIDQLEFFRLKHGSLSLGFDDTLNSVSQSYADNLMKTGTLQTRNTIGFSESLFKKWDPNPINITSKC